MIKNSFYVRLVFFGLLFAAAIYFVLTFRQTSPTASADVVVTSTPLYDITRHIAGTEITVGRILPAGANPHTFEPPPSAIRALSATKLVFAIGHGIDDWVNSIVTETAAEKITVDNGIILRAPIESAFGDDEDAHGGADPHYWLTIPNAKIIAANVTDALVDAFPDHAPIFRANLNGYLEKLDVADQKTRDTLAGLKNKKMVTLHDAWYYFAAEYGLDIIGTFEPSAGREPTPQYLAALSDAVAVSGVKVLYSEPGIATSGLEGFVKDHGLTIVTLDPVEGALEAPYIATMIRNAEIISAHQ